jgi:hypothetical protein
MVEDDRRLLRSSLLIILVPGSFSNGLQGICWRGDRGFLIGCEMEVSFILVLNLGLRELRKALCQTLRLKLD